jgi:hypothetical protein
MKIIRDLLNYLFGPTADVGNTLAMLQETVNQIKDRVSSTPPLLSTILNPGEKVYHMLRTVNGDEHVASVIWNTETNRLLSEDLEAQIEFDSLSAFGEHHYKTVSNNRKTASCRGYKECYVIRDGRRYQMYELLP